MLRCSLGLDDDDGEALSFSFLERCDDDRVNTDQHKKSETRTGPGAAATVRAVMTKAKRRNNCMVRLKRLCPEEANNLICRRIRVVDLWTHVFKSKIKSGSATNCKSHLKNVVNHFIEFNEDILPENVDEKKLESVFKVPFAT